MENRYIHINGLEYMFAQEILDNNKQRALLESKIGIRRETIDTVFDLRISHNEEKIEGAAMASYDAESNIARMYFLWDGVPKYEVMAYSAGSVVCFSYSTFSKALFGAKNISSVTGFPFKADVTYNLQDENGELTMKALQKGEVQITDGQRHGLVEVDGKFFKDYKLKSSPGYSAYLRQIETGVMEAVYNQIQYGQDGKTYYNQVKRHYKYNGKETLPFDETMVFKVIDTDFGKVLNGNRTDYVAQATYYVPSDYRDYSKNNL